MGIWLILTIWMLLAAVFVLAICAAAAGPIPQPVAANVEKRRPRKRETEAANHLPLVYANQRSQIGPLGITSLACLLLAGLLWAGCAASRSYPGPVHGLTFNGTVKSINMQDHRLTVAPLKPGEPTVFVWESTTKFWKNGVPIQPESLEPTWPVRVHYHETSGQLITHHVYVQAVYPVVH